MLCHVTVLGQENFSSSLMKDIFFKYYGHRDKLRLIGREDELEKLNKDALKIARTVADETSTLMAGNISNIACLNVGDPASEQAVKAMFKVRN